MRWNCARDQVALAHLRRPNQTDSDEMATRAGLGIADILHRYTPTSPYEWTQAPTDPRLASPQGHRLGTRSAQCLWHVRHVGHSPSYHESQRRSLEETPRSQSRLPFRHSASLTDSLALTYHAGRGRAVSPRERPAPQGLCRPARRTPVLAALVPPPLSYLYLCTPLASPCKVSSQLSPNSKL